jgi:hypothetical protein
MRRIVDGADQPAAVTGTDPTVGFTVSARPSMVTLAVPFGMRPSDLSLEVLDDLLAADLPLRLVVTLVPFFSVSTSGSLRVRIGLRTRVVAAFGASACTAGPGRSALMPQLLHHLRVIGFRLLLELGPGPPAARGSAAADQEAVPEPGRTLAPAGWQPERIARRLVTAARATAESVAGRTTGRKWSRIGSGSCRPAWPRPRVRARAQTMICFSLRL